MTLDHAPVTEGVDAAELEPVGVRVWTWLDDDVTLGDWV